ncbi:hypothetical protein COB55_03090 [Candidatus Wolfebacteria bacterium]|nr:MAG: hypothetical protein COB55_03090 [Candidatus Wolfebacteria bacterium]
MQPSEIKKRKREDEHYERQRRKRTMDLRKEMELDHEQHMVDAHDIRQANKMNMKFDDYLALRNRVAKTSGTSTKPDNFFYAFAFVGFIFLLMIL